MRTRAASHRSERPVARRAQRRSHPENRLPRSFAPAILRTDGGGEIVAVDSAGYGGVAIDRSVAIIAAPGAFAGVTVSSGDAIAIGASGLDVTLHGLTINGLGRAVAESPSARQAASPSRTA